jgi:hypothetical protein
MPKQKTILAVAIGDPKNTFTFQDASDTNLNEVRPYIRGLIDWLSKQPAAPKPKEKLDKYQIGKDYVIQYRECKKDDLANLFKNLTSKPDLIFCMSTTVVQAAAGFADTNEIPVVGIVSDPAKEKFGTMICGVSAKRSQHASDCYDQFKEALSSSSLRKIFYLHKVNYGPSEDAKYWLPNDDDAVPVPIGPTDGIDVIKKAIDRLPEASGGLLVLPVDQFFGAGAKIVEWAKSRSLPTFWSVPDWPPGAFGGYGVPQKMCGRYMGERVAYIWSKGRIPKPPFVQIPDKHFELGINKAVAKALLGKTKKK